MQQSPGLGDVGDVRVVGRHKHRQPVFLVELISTQSPQQLNVFEAKLVETGSVAWLMVA